MCSSVWSPVRPYFALPTVLDGMFKLARRIFGIEITAADGEEEVRGRRHLDSPARSHLDWLRERTD